MSSRPSAKFAVFSSLLLSAALSVFAAEPELSARHLKRETTRVAAANLAPTPTSLALPLLPDGVSELKFQDFFKTPVGPRGLETTAALESLNGKRVRIVGYMVREKAADADDHLSEDASAPAINGPVADRFLLTPAPQMTNYAHYGLCEDLPPQTLYVTLTDRRQVPVPFTPGPLLLTGILHLGVQTEPDGRTSVVRLSLDAAPTAPAAPVQR